MNTLIVIACFLTARDPETVRLCSDKTRYSVLFHMVIQLAVAGVVFYLIYRVAERYLTDYAPGLIATGFTVLVLALDRMFSRLKIKGGKVYWLALPLRLLFSLTLSLAVSVPVSLSIQKGSIEQYLHDQRVKHLGWYQQAIEDKRQQLENNQQTTLNHLNQRIHALNTQLKQNQQSRIKLESQIAQFGEQRNHELSMVVRHSTEIRLGARCGPICTQHQNRADALQRDLNRVNRQLLSLTQDIQGDKTERNTLTARKDQTENQDLIAHLTRYEQQLQQDIRYQQIQPSLTDEIAALIALSDDPDKGEAVRNLSLVAGAVIMMLELMGLLYSLFYPDDEYRQTEIKQMAFVERAMIQALQKRMDTQWQPLAQVSSPKPVAELV